MSSDAAAGRTIGGIALRTGKPAWWNDVAQDAEVPERDRPRFLASGIAAAGSFPLMVDAKPIALLGKVFCKVDAQFGPIEVGDLLTTSPTQGHAMRVADPLRAFGAVIGKALRPLAGGQGLIPILIALQ